MITQVPIIKGDKIGIETDYRDALNVNVYAVKREIMGAAGYILSYPGLTSFGTGSGIDRGAVYNERFGKQFRVSGQKLIEVNANGTITELGDIPGTDQVRMPYSFNTQAIIGNGSMWLYDPVSGFRQIVDPDIGTPGDGDWIDNYYFLTDGDYLYHTEITNEESIDPLSYATAEFMPDNSLGIMKTQDNKVIVFGRYTLEYFVNIATANFSFQRIDSRAQKVGIVATHAKTELNGRIYITGGRKDESVSVHLISVGAAEKVATREIDKLLSKYSEPDLSNIRMESRVENDVSFVLVHLPDEVLCFNESVAQAFGKETAWTILKTDVNGDDPYRAINGVFDPRISKWVYGDKLGATLGTLDNDASTHYGEIVESIFYTPFMNLETQSVDSLELETIPGHTTTDDAKVAFSITENGLTYGNEWWSMYGLPNEYNERFILNRLGHCESWIGMKFRTASASRMAFSMLRLTHA
jgi:hypothetical protein